MKLRLQRAQYTPLNQCGEAGPHREREGRRRPRRPAPPGCNHRGIGAQGQKGAMGEVDDPQDAIEEAIPDLTRAHGVDLFDEAIDFRAEKV